MHTSYPRIDICAIVTIDCVDSAGVRRTISELARGNLCQPFATSCASINNSIRSRAYRSRGECVSAPRLYNILRNYNDAYNWSACFMQIGTLLSTSLTCSLSLIPFRETNGKFIGLFLDSCVFAAIRRGAIDTNVGRFYCSTLSQ